MNTIIPNTNPELHTAYFDKHNPSNPLLIPIIGWEIYNPDDYKYNPGTSYCFPIDARGQVGWVNGKCPPVVNVTTWDWWTADTWAIGDRDSLMQFLIGAQP